MFILDVCQFGLLLILYQYLTFFQVILGHRQSYEVGLLMIGHVMSEIFSCDIGILCPSFHACEIGLLLIGLDI